MNAAGILQLLPEDERSRVEALEVFAELGSTNSYLLQEAAPPPGRFRVAIAESQTEGRGRLGRRWISPPRSGLCLSLSCKFVQAPPNLPSLTLAIGAAVAAALRTMGADDVALKWPNDIVVCGGKLGGILTEVRPEVGGGQTVVIGLGLNVDLPEAMREAPGERWASRIVDLKQCVASLPSLPVLAAGILQCLLAAVTRFERDGFEAFYAAWQDCDWLKGKGVSIPQAEEEVRGVASGIDSGGALLVETARGTRRIVTGSVTLTDSAVA
ncbi:MAG TPA: biotin--[acetyl-CoA-carboxylase] ligase [Woeseiaceae bacterium]|nr:biotin--[acetyl-CoA-carboxylase] ligase [Woeseiaceae bacterium]